MENENRNRRKKTRHTLFWIIVIEFTLAAAGLVFLVLSQQGKQPDLLLDMDSTIEYFTEEIQTEPDLFVPAPEIDEQLLPVNEYSRPGTKLRALNYIVIHYLGNPNTTAQENHDYFESLKDLKNVSMSANYVVGMEGEIIHCVPDNEVAYASNRANNYSISVENCHPDKSGRFTQETYTSLVKLVAYLSEKYGIDREHIIRHYDVTGKDCPKYFVDHEDKWESFRDDVMNYRKQCKQEVLDALEEERSRETEYHELQEFLATQN